MKLNAKKKDKKEAAPKTAAVNPGERHAIDATAIETSKVVSMNDIQFMSAVRTSKYEGIIEEATNLKVGQALPLTIGSGDDPISVRNNLGAILRRRSEALPHVLTVRRMRGAKGEEQVAIVAVERRARKAKA